MTAISAEDAFKSILWDENGWHSKEIWVKFVPKGPINNDYSLIRVIVWRPPGDQPLSELMVS